MSAEPEHTHDRHAGHSVGMFRARFWVSLVLTAPTLVFGHMISSALGVEPPSPGSMWIPPVLGTIVFAYGGWPFLQGAVRELRDRLPGMMTLITLAISVAFAFSVTVTIGYPGMPLWEELAARGRGNRDEEVVLDLRTHQPLVPIVSSGCSPLSRAGCSPCLP